MNSTWQRPNTFPVLADDELHVWKCGLLSDETDLASRLALLSDDERERASQFKVDRPRHQFIIARSTLRSLIGKYLEVPPGDVEFQLSDHGKPLLLNPPRNLEFNISHSHELALLAFSWRISVGVDIEWLGRKIAHVDVSKRFFSQLEQEQLNSLPAEDHHRVFLECWTRKEAYLKARGSGLSRDTRTFSVSIAIDTNSQLLQDQIDPAAVQSWRIHPLQPQTEYCGALACESTIATVQFLRYC